MFKDNKAFSGFSINSIAEAKNFYGEVLGMDVEEFGQMGVLSIGIDKGGKVMMYEKTNHEPASFTVLNFPVDNIDKAVDELIVKGIKFEIYEGFEQDKKGIARGKESGSGPDIAWFKDPAGNILSVIEE